MLPEVRAVLALGRIAFDAYLRLVYASKAGSVATKDLPPRSCLVFGHGASYALPGDLPRLFTSYHPSQQNTQTGRLTPGMMRTVFEDIREYLAKARP